MFILFAIRSKLDAVLLRNDQGDLQDVDRIQTQTLAVKRRFGSDLGRGHIEVQCLDDEVRNLSLQGGATYRRRRLSNWRRVVWHTG